MILNDIFTLPTSRPDLEVCTKFGTPGVFAGPRTVYAQALRTGGVMSCVPVLILPLSFGTSRAGTFIPPD